MSTVKLKILIPISKFVIIFALTILHSCNSTEEADLTTHGTEIDPTEIYRSGEENGGRFFTNKLGDTLFDGRIFYNTYEFSHGYCVVTDMVDGIKKNGVINHLGEVVVPIKFEGTIDSYEEGGYFKFYQQGSGFGYLDSTGKIVIDPIFKGSNFVKNGQIKLENYDSKWGIMNMSGDTIVNFIYNYIGKWSNNRAFVEIKERKTKGYRYSYKYIDQTGAVIGDDATFDFGRSFENGIALVKKNDLIGFIDTNCQLVIDYQYSDYKEIVDVYENVGMPTGYEQINNRFMMEEGFIIVKKGDFWGYIDAKGKVIIPFEFDWVDVLSGGSNMVDVKKNGKNGFYSVYENKLKMYDN